ncbi:MAG: tetratricopeptide repeat protein [Limisphaerales bacterium]
MNQFLAKRWTPFLLLGIATLLIWGQTVTFSFVWDDDFFIRDLQSVRSLRNIPEMFYRLDAQATLPDEFKVFRPLRTAHYALLHFLGGKEIPQPWIYHLANVLWHGATAMMLFAALKLLLSRLCKNISAAEVLVWSFWIALAFAIHPVVSEVVCWAKSLDDILATFFTLAALRELLLPVENMSARWRSLLFFALAVYSKESAVPFAIIPLVIGHRMFQLPWKQNFIRMAGFPVVAAIYAIHRHLVIGQSSQTAPISGTYTQTLVDMLPVVPEYFRLLFGIPPFCIDYSYLSGGYRLCSLDVLTGAILLLVLLAAGFLAWRRPDFRLAGFGLLWTGLFLLPVSNLLPMMQYMAERFLYLPLIGWLMAFAAILINLSRQKIVTLFSFAILLLWAITAWNRSWIWRDPVTLFVRSSQEGPKTRRVENNAVAAIMHLPNVERLFAYDEKNNKLQVQPFTGTTIDSSVLETLAQAHKLFPANHVILSAYGITLATAGQPQTALPFFEQATKLQPDNLDYRLNLARAALDAGQTNIAAIALEQAAALQPDNPGLLQLRFKFYWQTENYAAARETMLRLNQMQPSEDHAYWLAEVEKKLKATNSILSGQK